MSNDKQAVVYESDWFGQLAYVIETSQMKVITTPTVGAKIVSVFDKKAECEWLLPAKNRPFEPITYGASFVAQDMSGWDEMLPTIDSCNYPATGDYKDAYLPDHGEVWSLPWEVSDLQTDAITMGVTGRVLPHHFKRSIRAINASTIRLEYTVLNTLHEEIQMLWAAHPQFKVDSETRIVLPPEVTTVLNVQETQDWGAVGLPYQWPDAQTLHGRPFALDRINSAALHKYRKFYLPPDQPVQWAALAQLTTDNWLRLRWESAQVPYLGIWVDEGTFNSEATAALEPSTGFYDSLTRASQNNRVMCIPPNANIFWYLDIEIGSGVRNIQSSTTR